MKHDFYSSIVFICMIASVVVSCEKQEIDEVAPQLVVEGYIDDNDFPVVILTTSVSPQNEMKLDSIGNHLLRWARVAISDGEQEVVLTGKVDRNYFPPFIYTTTRMRGQIGKSYTLTIDYGEYHATAVTTIPEKPSVDSMWVKPILADSLCNIIVTFTDDISQHNYYKAFVRRGRYGRQWLPAYLGTINDDVLGNGASEMVVNRAGTLTDVNDYSPYFSYGDTITVKFAQIDEDAYRFWNDFDNNTNFSRNPFTPVIVNLRGNIKGGIGCWYGCGSVKKSFILDDYRRINQHD